MNEKEQKMRDDSIRELARKGYTIKDISEFFDISRQTLWKVIHTPKQVKDLTTTDKSDILSSEAKN